MSIDVRLNSPIECKPIQQVRVLRVGEQLLTQERVKRLRSLVTANIAKRSVVHDQAQQQLQQLLKRGATFRAMQPLLNKMYLQDNSLAFQARIIELAVEHGERDDGQRMLAFLSQSGSEFYLHISPNIRSRLVDIFWSKAAASPLKDILSQHKNHEGLEDIERLYVFDLLRYLRIPSEMLVYFEQHSAAILAAAQQRKMDIDDIYLLLGKASLQLSYLDGCRRFLRAIKPTAKAYRAALQLLLIPPPRNNPLMQTLLAERKWENRLTLLEQYIATAKSKNPLIDADRPALNAVLENVLKLVPRQREAWMQLSDLLVRHRNMEEHYPNLFHVFRQYRYTFCGAGLDTSLWHGFLRLEEEQFAQWVGFAHLHHYVSCGSSGEKSLWRARILLEHSELWQRAHSAAIAYVRNDKAIPAVQRDKMLLQLRVACLAQDLLLSDVQAYLPICTSRYVLAVLEDIVRDKKKDAALEIAIIWRRANLSHFRNQDLNRLWCIARERKLYDMAWRSATVLNARQSLQPLVRNAWRISGEKRTRYPLQAIDDKTLELAATGFSEHECKFLVAFFKIGAIIPSLFARLDNKAKTYRAPLPEDKNLREVEQFLRATVWLTPTKKNFYFSYDALLTRNKQLPLFLKNVPKSVWSDIFVRLVEKLSLNHWSWQLSTLMNTIDKVLPRFVTRSTITARATSWLAHQPAERRNAWSVFTTQARKISDSRAEEIIGAYLCRLATCIYQNHYQALLSLQLMQAPVVFIWHLETFLLSESYYELRKQQEGLYQVAIPHSIIKMQSITS